MISQRIDALLTARIYPVHRDIYSQATIDWLFKYDYIQNASVYKYGVDADIYRLELTPKGKTLADRLNGCGLFNVFTEVWNKT